MSPRRGASPACVPKRSLGTRCLGHWSISTLVTKLCFVTQAGEALLRDLVPHEPATRSFAGLRSQAELGNEMFGSLVNFNPRYEALLRNAGRRSSASRSRPP